MLPKEAIEEFKRIYKEIFKEDLDENEASQKARKLLDFYKVVYIANQIKNGDKKYGKSK